MVCEHHPLFIIPGHFLQQSICTNSGPTFYQHVTQNIFTNLVNQTYSTTTHPTLTISTESITNIEENVLQYVAGYICKKSYHN